MVAAIIACEVGFWVLLVAGLAARYLIRARKLSVALLVSVPLVDVALLAFSVVDLRHGGTASSVHGLAAIYLGVSVAFGHRMMRWADRRFAHRFAGGPPPVKPPRRGPERARLERRGWLRHLLAYVIGAAVLGIFTPIAGGFDTAAALWSPMGIWTIVLLIDLVVALSYTSVPRRDLRDPEQSQPLRTRPALHDVRDRPN